MRAVLCVFVLAGCGGLTEAKDELGVAESALECQQNICPPQQPPPTELIFPGGAQTLQGAIDAIADGGTVRLAPGDYSVNLVINAKSVSLTGEGNATLRGADPAQPTVAFGPGGGGRIAQLDFRGQNVAILGRANGDAVPASLTIEDVNIKGAVRGVLGSFSDLTVVSSKIHDSAGHAISIDRIGTLDLHKVGFLRSGGAGVFVDNHGLPCAGLRYDHTTQNDNAYGGIAIYDAPCPVTITNGSFRRNALAGIVLFDTGDATITKTTITESVPRDKVLGDGLAFWSTRVTADELSSSYNARAGISMFGCGTADASALVLSNSLLRCNPVDINLVLRPDSAACGGVGVAIEDKGTNECPSHFDSEKMTCVKNESLDGSPPGCRAQGESPGTMPGPPGS